MSRYIVVYQSKTSTTNKYKYFDYINDAQEFIDSYRIKNPRLAVVLYKAVVF